MSDYPRRAGRSGPRPTSWAPSSSSVSISSCASGSTEKGLRPLRLVESRFIAPSMPVYSQPGDSLEALARVYHVSGSPPTLVAIDLDSSDSLADAPRPPSSLQHSSLPQDCEEPDFSVRSASNRVTVVEGERVPSQQAHRMEAGESPGLTSDTGHLPGPHNFEIPLSFAARLPQRTSSSRSMPSRLPSRWTPEPRPVGAGMAWPSLAPEWEPSSRPVSVQSSKYSECRSSGLSVVPDVWPPPSWSAADEDRIRWRPRIAAARRADSSVSDAPRSQSSMAAWDEDMPRATPSELDTPHLGSFEDEVPMPATPATAQSSPPPPLSRFSQLSGSSGAGSLSAASEPLPPIRPVLFTSAPPPAKIRGLFSLPDAARSGATIGTAADSDSEDEEEADDIVAETRLLATTVSPFGRNSFGCEAEPEDTTEARSRRLREGISSQNYSGSLRSLQSDSRRSRSSLLSSPHARRSVASLPRRASLEVLPSERTHASALARTISRPAAGSNDSLNSDSDPSDDESSTESTPPPVPSKTDLTGLRGAMLSQPGARQSFTALRSPPPGSAPAALRKQSIANMIRKRQERERRLQFMLAHDVIPEGISSADVYMAKQKYLRRSLLQGGEPEVDEVFSVWRPPSQRRLWEAGTCNLRDEEGNVLPFSDLFPRWPETPTAGPPPRTIVFFLRMFWCGMCQTYTMDSISRLDPEVLAANNINVVVIGQGHWRLLKPYRELFNCPFPFYTDGPRKLYHLMGMIKDATMTLPPKISLSPYAKARPVLQTTLRGIKNGLVSMPIERPGAAMQLGGEFILSPGYKCDFAHRMTTLTNHMEAHDVLKYAGLEHPAPTEAPEAHTFTPEQLAAQDELERVARELADWRERRDAELARMADKKAARRGVGIKKSESDAAYYRNSATSGWTSYVAHVASSRPLSGVSVSAVGGARPWPDSAVGASEDEGTVWPSSDGWGGEYPADFSADFGEPLEEPSAPTEREEMDRAFAKAMAIEEARARLNGEPPRSWLFQPSDRGVHAGVQRQAVQQSGVLTPRLRTPVSPDGALVTSPPPPLRPRHAFTAPGTPTTTTPRRLPASGSLDLSRPRDNDDDFRHTYPAPRIDTGEVGIAL